MLHRNHSWHIHSNLAHLNRNMYLWTVLAKQRSLSFLWLLAKGKIPDALSLQEVELLEYFTELLIMTFDLLVLALSYTTEHHDYLSHLKLRPTIWPASSKETTYKPKKEQMTRSSWSRFSHSTTDNIITIYHILLYQNQPEQDQDQNCIISLKNCFESQMINKPKTTS